MDLPSATDLAPDAPIAAFDVDGTLTWTDSFVLFLRWVAGTGRFGLTMASVGPQLVAYRLGLIDRDAAKQAIVGGFLGGMDHGAYLAACRAYAASTYPLILRADGKAAIARHTAAGHRVLLVSASLEDYLLPLAAHLGAHGVLATRVSVAGPSLSGALDGANCWGPQKEARVRSAFPGARIIAAYGDSRGDRELLAAARADGGEGHLCLFKDQPADRAAMARRLWLAPAGSV